jgi:anthrone oxygenase-like protein
MDGRRLGAVVLAGVLTGSELTSQAIVHPALWKLNYPEQVRAEKLVYKRFGSIDPFLMTATTTACFIAASSLRGRAATLALAAGGSYSTMLAITLIGNMPINLRVFRWNEHEGDPEEWRQLRRRWDRLHSIRIPLDVAGFILITLAALQP